MIMGRKGLDHIHQMMRSQRYGRGDWIRTSDPLLPKQMRYQAAPLPGFDDAFTTRFHNAKTDWIKEQKIPLTGVT